MKKLILISLFLTACKSTDKEAFNIYQPNQLFLEAGKEISTKEGKYSPQTDEIWHSAKTVENLERKLSQF